MATERQIAANKRNAARSTGPRSTTGKARSRMNALRHGFAALLGSHGAMSKVDLDLESLSDRIARIEAERGKLIFKIETQLWEGKDDAVGDLVRQLDVLERYARRSASALRKK